MREAIIQACSNLIEGMSCNWAPKEGKKWINLQYLPLTGLSEVSAPFVRTAPGIIIPFPHLRLDA
jgi:hypothetical protein